jgi:hypothetical protein
MKNLSIVFLLLTPFLAAGQAGSPTNEIAPGLEGQQGASRAFENVIWSLDVQTITGDNQCLGCEFDGTYLWITGGGGTTNPASNKLYKINPYNGTLVNSYDQPTVSSWGIRDLCWVASDGLIYGGDENGLYSFNPVTETFSTVFSGHTFSTIRALAYDGSNFWTKDFSLQLHEFTVGGTLLNSYPATDAGDVYGAAIDRPDGCLYLFTQTGTAVFYQYDLNGNFSGKTYDVSNFPGTDVAGGSFIDYGVLVAGKNTLCGLIQGDPDTVIAIDLPMCGGVIPLSSWSILLAIALIMVTVVISIRRFR